MAIEIRPLSKYVGAEVTGIDLNKPLNAEETAAMHKAFNDYHLVLVKQPGLTDEAQIRVSELYGKLLVRNSYDGSMGKDIHYISNNRPDGVLPIGEIEFHHDQTFYENPVKAALLYAIEVPSSGSATRFRSAAELLNRMPEDKRKIAEDVTCLHFFNYDDNYGGKQDPTKDTPRAQKAWQPMVWNNPETKKKALWIPRITIVDYKGIDKDKGEEMLAEFWDIGEKTTDINYTHQWTTGDLIIWDNRMLAHARLPFNSSEARTLRRTSTIAA